MNTIDKMQNEKYFYCHYNTFIKQSLTDLYNYMCNYTWLYVHLYE